MDLETTIVVLASATAVSQAYDAGMGPLGSIVGALFVCLVAALLTYAILAIVAFVASSAGASSHPGGRRPRTSLD